MWRRRPDRSLAAEQLDPEEWSEIINASFEFMIKPIYHYEGIVARLMGNGNLAFFDAPIAHDTYRLVKPLFEFEELSGIEVKGMAEWVRAYRVLGTRELSGRARGIEGLRAEMVGRTLCELAEIDLAGSNGGAALEHHGRALQAFNALRTAPDIERTVRALAAIS